MQDYNPAWLPMLLPPGFPLLYCFPSLVLPHQRPVQAANEDSDQTVSMGPTFPTGMVLKVLQILHTNFK